ncbi:MAG TPA: hypothetical protein VFQ00_02075 [Terriglobales bacterium]|nr:hypothetical protein [Terriglobales bacterium]
MPEVLLLEDLDSDVREVQSALEQIGDYQLKHFDMAPRAIEFLSDKLEQGAELPALIIADLNLPNSSGYELLRFYHGNAGLRSVPCVVWSVMDGDTERKLTEWMGAHTLISKNSGPKTLRKSLAAVLSPDSPRKRA